MKKRWLVPLFLSLTLLNATGADSLPSIDIDGSLSEDTLENNRPESVPSPETGQPRQVTLEESPSNKSSDYSEISDLEFKMKKADSIIVLTATRKPVFKRINSGNTQQIVLLFESVQTPERLQRAYDTSEFKTPVALFTLFQLPSSNPPVSKLIIQMREPSEPKITVEGNSMTLVFPPPKLENIEPIIGSRKDQMLTGSNIYSKDQKFSGEVIEKLEIKNSEVQDVLRLIARNSGFNIVIGDDVTGKIGTLSLENLPWDQVFTLVLQSKKLGYVRDGNVIRVSTTASIKAEKDEGAKIDEAIRRSEPLKTLLIPVSYAKAATLAPRATSLLSERGKVETDERTNTIIVKDIESMVGKIQKLIVALDTPPPRVQITARIMEMKEQFTRQIGFNNLTFNQGFGGLNLTQANNYMSFSSTTAGSTVIGLPKFANLQTQLSLGEQRKEARTLANPTVIVVANQAATVTHKTTLFVPTSNLVQGAGSQNSYIQVPVSLNLNVTPIVAGDGSIFMNLNISNDILQTTETSQFSVDNRSINTQMLLENGGTAVIGGVFKTSFSGSKNGIPGLQDIPIVGFFFSGKNSFEDRGQVLIFITARILNAEESFKRTL